jgi:5-methylcytosine-specific restriction endonuclease McrA
MGNVLKKQVLMLNRNWQAINSKTVEEIMPMIVTGVATALDIESETLIRPVKWDEWITLPVRPQDDAIHTPKMTIRVPTVVAVVQYAKLPKRRPKLNIQGLAARDGHTDQYTGKKLARDEMSIDHVMPRSRGGKHEWTNIALTAKKVNQAKKDKTPSEAGLKLLKEPKEPLPLPASAFLTPTHPDHKIFLKK